MAFVRMKPRGQPIAPRTSSRLSQLFLAVFSSMSHLVERSDSLFSSVGLEVLQHHLPDHQARFSDLRILHGARFARFRSSTLPPLVSFPFDAQEARQVRVRERSTTCFFRRDSSAKWSWNQSTFQLVQTLVRAGGSSNDSVPLRGKPPKREGHRREIGTVADEEEGTSLGGARMEGRKARWQYLSTGRMESKRRRGGKRSPSAGRA